jgi:hypothetical protein
MDRIFNIDSGNGSIFTSKVLDRETLLWHNITVIATEISKSNLVLLSPIDGLSCTGGLSMAETHHYVLMILLDTVLRERALDDLRNVSSKCVLVHS